jgi:hypothetical protein
MLEANGFEVVDEFAESYSNGNSYTSWGLIYTLTPELETIEQMYSDTECHISIHRTKSSSGWSYRIDWSPDITMCDLGLRIDKEAPIPITPQGSSVAAGLMQRTDGGYETTDGRLSANLGTATVLLNGMKHSGTVSFETTDKGIDVLTVSGYNSSDKTAFIQWLGMDK